MKNYLRLHYASKIRQIKNFLQVQTKNGSYEENSSEKVKSGATVDIALFAIAPKRVKHRNVPTLQP